MLLLASCGQQYAAKQKVKEFVRQHATDEIDITSFSDLDSTRVISDSLLQTMRKTALSDPLFKDVRLGDIPKSPTLLYIRMRFNYEGQEMAKTFYFDPDLEGIVMFK